MKEEVNKYAEILFLKKETNRNTGNEKLHNPNKKLNFLLKARTR
jgi:hypothetical protein